MAHSLNSIILDQPLLLFHYRQFVCGLYMAEMVLEFVVLIQMLEGNVYLVI